MERTPKGLADCLIRLADPTEGRVFDPFCGASGILPRIMEERAEYPIEVVGQNWHVEGGKPHLETGAPPMPFDFLLTSFPFPSHGGNDRSDSAALLESMRGLNPGGQCACIVSSGLLGRSGRADQLVREALACSVDLHALILLPEDAFAASRVFSVLLYFTNRPPSGKGICVIDLRKQGITAELLEQIPDAVKGKKTDKIPVLWLPRERIAAPGYTLTPDFYFPPEGENEGGAVPLRKRRAEHILQQLDQEFLRWFPAPVATAGETAGQVPDGCGKTRGDQLFTIKNGQPLPKGCGTIGGKYPLYQGAGICGYTDLYNVEAPLPTIIINRVGLYCGRVHLTEERCFVQPNSMYLSDYGENFDPIFLFFLFRAAHFNQWKLGSTKAYIRKEAILDTWFITPPLGKQKEFVGQIWPRMRSLLDIQEEEMSGLRQQTLF